ncbi:hypothetical protein [Streptomyces sp. NPDC049879]|uniref:hypothetical protein n=1 Tax=Streptomyces sp. NPDC049879 TaxID=3365598 RepID=UPI0037AB93BB
MTRSVHLADPEAWERVAVNLSHAFNTYMLPGGPDRIPDAMIHLQYGRARCQEIFAHALAQAPTRSARSALQMECRSYLAEFDRAHAFLIASTQGAPTAWPLLFSRPGLPKVEEWQRQADIAERPLLTRTPDWTPTVNKETCPR